MFVQKFVVFVSSVCAELHLQSTGSARHLQSKINKVLDTTTETTIKELGLLRQSVITPDPTAAKAPIKRHRKRCARRQKRGKRGGIRARLATSPTRPAIPSIIMANVQSLENKMDHISVK